MSEQKTLIEQLAKKRDEFPPETPTRGVSTDDKPSPTLIKNAVPINAIEITQTLPQVIRRMEPVEHASLLEQHKLTSRRAPLFASAAKWAATIAVVAAGIVCFVYLPSPSGSTPAVSGPNKPVVPETSPALAPPVAPKKDRATAVPRVADYYTRG